MITAIAFIALAGQAPTFPPIVKDKTLYAKNDFRGKKAPKFEFGTWLNQPNPNTKGKVVVLDFWATWCGPCRALIPELNQWQKEFAKDVVVIGISDEKPEVVTKFMKEMPMNYSVATDPKGLMKGAFGVEGIPHVVVITPDGIVRWQGFPPMTEDLLDTAKLRQIILASKKR